MLIGILSLRKGHWRERNHSFAAHAAHKTGLTARFVREALPMTFHFLANFPVHRAPKEALLGCRNAPKAFMSNRATSPSKAWQ
jgi:hypothetical protein